MKAYLILEGDSELALVRRLLPSEIQSDISIVTAGGRSNIASKARSLMVMRRKPVALVTDADAIDKDAVEQRRRTLEDLMRSATTGVPYKVVLAVPEIESWLFVVPDVLERMSGKKLSNDQRELGDLRPKKVIQQLFENQRSVSVAELASNLTDPELQALRETEPRKELIDFLSEAVKKEPQHA